MRHKTESYAATRDKGTGGGTAPKHRGGKHHKGGNSPRGNPTRQQHRQPGAGLAGMGDGGGHSIDESIGSAKRGRQTAPKAETIASLEF